jgi:hypothetical protein
MKKFIILSLIVSAAVLSAPVSAKAFSCSVGSTPETFGDTVCLFIDLASTAIPIVAGIALMVFFYGIAKFIYALQAGDEGGTSDGKEVMKWGIVALFVMVSIWGIVYYLVGDVFGTTPYGVPMLPIQ